MLIRQYSKLTLLSTVATEVTKYGGQRDNTANNNK